MKAMTIRGLKLYFKNKGTVFFSLLSVLIMFSIFAFFLGDAMTSDMEDIEGGKMIINSWLIAGMLASTSISSSIGAYNIMVTDRDDKIIKDFFSSPMKRSNVLIGYILTGFIVSIVMCLVIFIFGEIYILLKGGSLLSFSSFIQLFLVMIVSSFSSSSIICFTISFVKKNSTYSALSALLGTLIGFLTGSYLPIGNLPNGMQTFIKLFPPMHSASLFRQIMMKDSIDVGFNGASEETILKFKDYLGVSLSFSGEPIKTYTYFLVLIGSGILFYSLAVLNISKKAKTLNS